MARQTRRRFSWHNRNDGSAWAQIELNAAQGIVAVIDGRDGSHSSTVVFELPIANLHKVGDAKTAVENWLIEIGAIPGSGADTFD